jgi:hypothetical protein
LGGEVAYLGEVEVFDEAEHCEQGPESGEEGWHGVGAAAFHLAAAEADEHAFEFFGRRTGSWCSRQTSAQAVAAIKRDVLRADTSISRAWKRSGARRSIRPSALAGMRPDHRQ